MWRSPSVPHVISSLLTIPLLYGRWSTSGSDRGNAHFFTATSNTIEGTGGKRTNDQTLGVNSSAEGELSNTLCMCRLTLVWILAKLPQSNWNADSSWLDLLHWSGPYLLPIGLSAPVSGVDCLVPGPAPTPTSSSFVQPTLFSRPLPLPVTARSQVRNPLSGFAPKQTKESSAWRATYIVLHRHVWRLKLRSKPAQLYVRLIIIPLSQQAYHVSSGIIRYQIVAFVCLHFIP